MKTNRLRSTIQNTHNICETWTKFVFCIYKYIYNLQSTFTVSFHAIFIVCVCTICPSIVGFVTSTVHFFRKGTNFAIVGVFLVLLRKPLMITCRRLYIQYCKGLPSITHTPDLLAPKDGRLRCQSVSQPVSQSLCQSVRLAVSQSPVQKHAVHVSERQPRL